MAFKNRNKGMTTDMKDFVRTLADTHIPLEDVLMCFRRKYPIPPLITSQDVKNMVPQWRWKPGCSQPPGQTVALATT